MVNLHLLYLPQETQAATQEPAPNGGGEGGGAASSLFGGGFLVPMLLIFGIFYFVLIRPERKKQRTREGMLKTLKKGDKVLTTSGIYANVVGVQEDLVTLQVADGVRIRFTRAAVQAVLESEKSSAKD